MSHSFIFLLCCCLLLCFASHTKWKHCVSTVFFPGNNGFRNMCFHLVSYAYNTRWKHPLRVAYAHTHMHTHARMHARTRTRARARAHTHTQRETCSVNTHRHGGSECEPSRGNSGNEKRPDAPPHTGHWCVCKRLPPSLSLVRSPARSLAYFLALCSLFIFIYLYLTPYTQVRKRTRTTWSVFSIAI